MSWIGCSSRIVADCSWIVMFNNPVDPGDVVPHFGVDSREVCVRATDTPGDDALELAIADKGTTRVTLWTKTRDDEQTYFSTSHKRLRAIQGPERMNPTDFGDLKTFSLRPYSQQIRCYMVVWMSAGVKLLWINQNMFCFFNYLTCYHSLPIVIHSLACLTHSVTPLCDIGLWLPALKWMGGFAFLPQSQIGCEYSHKVFFTLVIVVVITCTHYVQKHFNT